MRTLGGEVCLRAPAPIFFFFGFLFFFFFETMERQLGFEDGVT